MILNGDTIVAINQDQLKTINKTFLDYYSQIHYIDDLDFQFKSISIINEKQALSIRNLSKNNADLLTELNRWEAKDKVNSELQDYYKREIKNYKKKQVKVALVGGLVGISVTSILFIWLRQK